MHLIIILLVERKVGSILDFGFDIDTGQKICDTISIFSRSVGIGSILVHITEKEPCGRVGENGCQNTSMLLFLTASL